MKYCWGRYIYICDSINLMNKKKLILSILTTVVAVATIVVCMVFVFKPFTSKGDGTITVEYVKIDGTVAKSKDITYYEGDTLMQLIDDNFENVLFSSDNMLMNIEDFVTPSDFAMFLMIYVNDEMSNVGIKDIEFTDGMVISLRVTEFVYDFE